MVYDTAGMSSRYRASFLALGLAAVLLAGLLWMRREDLSLLGELEVSWPLMIGAISLTVVGTILSFVRWYLLVKAQGLPFTIFDALRLGLIGTFFNFLIPGAVGGDLVKAALIAREQSSRLLAISTIVVDRIVGLLGLLVLTGLVAIVGWGAIQDNDPLAELAQWNLGLLGIALAALAVFLLWRWPLEDVASRVRRIPKLGPPLASLVDAAGSYQQAKGSVLAAVLFSILIQALFVASLVLGGLSLWPEAPPLSSYLVAIPFGLLSTGIPVTPGGLGVAEVTLEALFSFIGAPASYALLMMLGFRLGQVATVALGVLLYWASPEVRGAAEALQK
jgi:uncharacterized membrane protein YbhN (UPF0104 family)